MASDSEILKFNPFKTSYNDDYIDYGYTDQYKPFPGNKIPEFRDPINRSFKTYLTVEGEEPIPPQEAATEYLEKFKRDYKKISKVYFCAGIDPKQAAWDKEVVKNSVYFQSYCDLAEKLEYAAKLRAKRVHLPEDIQLPLTTMTNSYRNPKDIYSKAGQKSHLNLRPESYFKKMPKIEKILKMQTGISEYNGVMGELAKFIIEDQVHGKLQDPTCI